MREILYFPALVNARYRRYVAAIFKISRGVNKGERSQLEKNTRYGCIKNMDIKARMPTLRVGIFTSTVIILFRIE